jgi:hypothetical protein
MDKNGRKNTLCMSQGISVYFFLLGIWNSSWNIFSAAGKELSILDTMFGLRTSTKAALIVIGLLKAATLGMYWLKAKETKKRLLKLQHKWGQFM